MADVAYSDSKLTSHLPSGPFDTSHLDWHHSADSLLQDEPPAFALRGKWAFFLWSRLPDFLAGLQRAGRSNLLQTRSHGEGRLLLESYSYQCEKGPRDDR